MKTLACTLKKWPVKPCLLISCVCALWLTALSSFAGDGKFAIVIHGGSSGKERGTIIAKDEKNYRETLEHSLRAGHAILKKGGSSLDAVEAAIVVLEDSPLFNAGKGAVFTLEGKNELDASIMDGKAIKAGAVGGVTTVKNPIRAARAVMDHTWHVLLTNEGAETFARKSGLESVPPEYFHTETKWRSYQKGLAKEKKRNAAEAKKNASLSPALLRPRRFGTVGAVALDSNGNIAAGTSTGGLMYKKFGRIGDSPIIGAGTYADNESCGISCTGQGEYFIRRAVAFDISARMKYLEQTLAEAARATIQKTLEGDGGAGGIIGIDRAGNIVGEFNSHGMVWASIDVDGKLKINY